MRRTAVLSAAVLWAFGLVLIQPAGVRSNPDPLCRNGAGRLSRICPWICRLQLRGGARLRRSSRMANMADVSIESDEIDWDGPSSMAIETEEGSGAFSQEEQRGGEDETSESDDDETQGDDALSSADAELRKRLTSQKYLTGKPGHQESILGTERRQGSRCKESEFPSEVEEDGGSARNIFYRVLRRIQAPLVPERPSPTDAYERRSRTRGRGGQKDGILESRMKAPVPPHDAVERVNSAETIFHGGLLSDNVKSSVRRAAKQGKLLVVWVPDDRSAVRATGGLQRDGADAGEGSGWQDPTLRVAMSTEVVGLCVLPDTRESDWLFQAFGAPPALPALYGVAPPGRLVGLRSGPALQPSAPRVPDRAAAPV